MSEPQKQELTPAPIIQLGLGFWASKTLLSAVELGLFTELAKGPLDEAALRQRLGLHARSAPDFFDALVALGMLRRENGRYSNSPEAGMFLDRAKPSYIGGMLEMCNARLYGYWGSLTEGLKTGKPQNEAKHGDDLFSALYSDPARLRGFLQAMTGISLGCARAIAAQFPWNEYKTFVDIGTAQGGLPVTVALAHPHLTGIGYDLPVVGPIFEEYVKSFALSGRLRFHAGSLFCRPAAERRRGDHGPHPPRLEPGGEAHAHPEGLRRAATRRRIHRVRGAD